LSCERPIVEVEDLVKDVRPGFGLRRKRILDGISLSVESGEIFGFVGPNGAGKTTTLKVLMGLARPTAGRARILGHDVRESAYRRHVGFLPEAPYFYPFLTGAEILRFYARLSGVPERRMAERVDELLAAVGLSHAADVRLRDYSKGMLQRVGIAQALVHDPRVVFLDEPMSGLDPIGRKEIRDLVLKLRDEGRTVFMNTHILSDVDLLCDRIAILVRGRVRYQGRVESFLAAEERESDVVVASLAPETAALLEERFGARIAPAGANLDLRVPEKQVDEVLRRVLEAGARVLSVSPRRPSVEEVFLSAVREGEAGDAAREESA